MKKLNSNQTLIYLINNWISLVRDGYIKDIEVQSIEKDDDCNYKFNVTIYNHDHLVLPYMELVKDTKEIEKQ